MNGELWCEASLYLVYLLAVASVGVSVHVLIRLFFVSALVLVRLLSLQTNDTFFFFFFSAIVLLRI